jgi:hypothetical protein
MRTEHVPAAVYIELGRAGLDTVTALGMITQAGNLASEQHCMGAEGRVPIPNTKRVLVYNGGIDGMDWRVYIEDEAPKSADELVRMAMNLIESHRNSTSYGYGSGPALYEWEGDARRYLKSQEAK